MYRIYSKLLNLESLQLRKRNADAFVLIISELMSLHAHKDSVMTCVLYSSNAQNLTTVKPPHTGPWGYCQYVNSPLGTQRVGHSLVHCSKFLGFFLAFLCRRAKNTSSNSCARKRIVFEGKSFEAVANMRYSIRCFIQMALLIHYLLLQRINQCQYFTLVLVNPVTSYHVSININNGHWFWVL